MKRALVTGGSGFLGSLMTKRLSDDGWHVVNIDLEPDAQELPNLTSIQGDIRDRDLMEQTFAKHDFDVVFHLAAILAHGKVDQEHLWTSNVDGTKRVVEMAEKHGVRRVVFTSSNCLWAEGFNRPVTEDDAPNPVEVYGVSKWEGEKALLGATKTNAVVVRCPTIIDAGRLGLLSILFEFIDDDKRLYVVGDGSNRYQFIYAQDLINALLRAAEYGNTALFGIGSKDVKSLREVYGYVIDKAGSKSKIASLPKGLTIPAMKLAHKLKVSPLGPYHYKMIAESFSFDISKITRELDWTPTLTNEEMLYRAYQYYSDNRNDIAARTNVSAHKQSAKMGVIRLLKWVS
ncbi:MAG: NAD(P)-dependent oxidoreductase [Labilithrix sp.]|nr:NAD(P)-dependent oxidoreductase [Labilithrix sp.]MCW5810495.1 NAD(P)-dependent oxidoreductase [Labilithrix sp.]